MGSCNKTDGRELSYSLVGNPKQPKAKVSCVRRCCALRCPFPSTPCKLSSHSVSACRKRSWNLPLPLAELAPRCGSCWEGHQGPVILRYLVIKPRFYFKCLMEFSSILGSAAPPRIAAVILSNKWVFLFHAKLLGLLNFLGAKFKIANSDNLQYFDSDPLKYIIVLITYSLV